MALPFCPHAECYNDHGEWDGCRYEDDRFPNEIRPARPWEEDEYDDAS